MSQTKRKATQRPETARNIKKLKQSWGFLKENLYCSDIINKLIEANLYPVEKWRALKNKHSIESDKIEEILMHIVERIKVDHKVYDVFIKALQDSNCPHVVRHLVGGNVQSTSDEHQNEAGQNPKDTGSSTTSLQITPNSPTEAGASGGVDMTELQRSLNDQLREHSEKMEETTERLRKEFTEKIESLRQEVVLEIKNAKEEEKTIETLKKENAKLRDAIQEKERELKRTVDVKKDRKELAELRVKLNGKTQELEVAKRRLLELQEKIKKIESQRHGAEGRIQTMNRFQTLPDIAKRK